MGTPQAPRDPGCLMHGGAPDVGKWLTGSRKPLGPALQSPTKGHPVFLTFSRRTYGEKHLRSSMWTLPLGPESPSL